MELHHLEYGLWTLVVLVILGIVCWGAVAFNEKQASLSLETTPASASVWIDGNFIGTAPLERERFPAGRHVLRALKSGHVDLVRWIDVVPGPNVLKFDLEKLPGGSLKITSTPPGAEVFIGGEPRGRSPVTIDELRPGAYLIRLRLVNYLDWTETVEVETNRLVNRNVTLKSRTEAGYLAAIRANSNDVIAYVDLAHYYILRDEWKKAEDAFTNALVVISREDGTSHYSGRLTQEIQKVWGMQFRYSDLKRGREVVTNAYVRAVEARPTEQRYYGTAIQYASDLGMTDKAQKVVETGILNFPHSHSWAVHTVPRWTRRGRNDDRVLRSVDSRLRKNPRDFVSHFQRMTIMRQRGNSSEVIKEYIALVPLTRNKHIRSRLLLELGRMHERKRDYDKAADAYRRASAEEIVPKDKAPIQYNLARVLDKLKRDSDTLAAWEHAVRYQENVELACRWRLDWARLAVRLKRLDKADEILKDVLKFSRDAKTTTSAQELLKSIRGTKR